MGRSPFINNLDVSKIDYNKFDVCCINSLVPNTQPKYLVSADVDVKPEIPHGCEWISSNTGWLFYTGKDILTENLNLSYSEFSSSLAVNFAILRGYKKIYLAGIDLIEDGKPFMHYDGILNNEITAQSRCEKDKKFIIDICEKNNVSIFNLNPICDWLPYEDIGLIK